MSRLARLKVSKGIVEAIVIGIVVFASSFLAIKASEDLLLDSVSDGVMSALFGQFQNGNQLIFDLSVGVLVSVLFYVAIVRIPELRKRRRAKANVINLSCSPAQGKPPEAASRHGRRAMTRPLPLNQAV